MGYLHDGHGVEASATKTHRGWKPELRIDGEDRSFAPTGRFQFKFFRDEEEALIYADASAEWLINNGLN
ncbi:MAG: hypothetical protein WBP70_16920 [Terriglobales bacterium]